MLTLTDGGFVSDKRGWYAGMMVPALEARSRGAEPLNSDAGGRPGTVE